MEDWVDELGSYRIKFQFDKNPYFTNKELVHDVTVVDRAEFELNDSERTATAIQWKKNMNLVRYS